MSIRGCALVLMMSLVLVGCPGGDGDGESEGNSGAGGGGSGDGGRSGTSGAGGGGSSNMSAEDVAAGNCNMTGGETECTGVEQYMACLNNTCGYDECYSGPCASYIDCLSNADDACSAAQDGTCSPSSECTSCFISDANCALNCASNLQCTGGNAGAGGSGSSGGAGAGGTAGVGGLPEGTCADLDACCASLPGDEGSSCMMVADAAKMAGDIACAVYIDAFCPE
jgi:hypothetical protein